MRAGQLPFSSALPESYIFPHMGIIRGLPLHVSTAHLSAASNAQRTRPMYQYVPLGDILGN